ncbi:DUF6602 domain-containing protein [Leucothrix mucor]|uniref:DUF6602 domain-containing protein n=1 Tax=Leucothrix mucor TaxID=45248 RepID=UPI0003B34F9C|nr:DUF6602 domain-containing protein [Leucothrix mucor]
MSDWNLRTILGDLHHDIQEQLRRARNIGHPSEKGDASEDVWLELFQQYLPERYHAIKAHVVDSEGTFSDQIDVVIFDRQYSPFIHNFKGSTVVPAESVYAVFEAKQTMDASLVSYAQKKVASVRRLKRTSLPIPHAGGEYPAKTPFHILGGMLTFESEWKPPFGDAFHKAVSLDGNGNLDLGCVASHGFFHFNQKNKTYIVDTERKPATAFLFRLISQLQLCGTVPMIDVEAYAHWLTE